MIGRTTLGAVVTACIALLGGSVATAVAAAPAWRVIAGSGPTHIPPRQSETQRVTIEADGGTFTLAQQTAAGTGVLSFGSAFSFYAAGQSQISVFGGTGAFTAGLPVSGPGIDPGTTITDVSGTTLTLSQPTTAEGVFAMVTARSKEVSSVVADSGTFRVGDMLSGPGLPAGTTVAAVGDGTPTLSNN